MAGRAVFIDTSALLVLVNSDGGLHGTAVAAYSQVTRTRVNLVTSEWWWRSS